MKKGFIIALAFLVIGFCTHSCKEKIIAPPINNGYDSSIYIVQTKIQKAQIAALELEKDSLSRLAQQTNTKYVYLTKFVVQDSSMLYQVDLMSGLLTLHTLRDTVVDTTGTILQRGNKRLIEYFAARDQLNLKDNIIKVQNSINRSLKEQIAIDSADRRDCVDALKSQTDKHFESSMNLEACREDKKELKKQRNGWRIATLALAAKDGIMLLLRN